VSSLAKSSPTLALVLLSLAALALALGGCVSDGITMVNGHANNAVSYVLGPGGEPARGQLFIASMRRGEDGTDGEGHPGFSLESISVPANHRVGAIERASFGGPDSKRHFALLSHRSMEEGEFLSEIAAHVSGRVGVSSDILLYVHGFNTSLDEARFRIVQIVADARFTGVPALFAWNSKGELFAYESDKESATVARDALEKLIVDLSHTPGVGRVHILAHSMGSWLTMEALRSISISGHPNLDGKLGEVMLAAPDIDLNVFERQIARLDPRHVSIFVANNDRALSLSSRIAGDRRRLGAMDPTNPKDKAELDRLGVTVHDISSFSTDFVGHGAFAEAPDVVRLIGAQLTAPRPADAGETANSDFRDGDTRVAPPPSPTPSQKAESQALPPLAAK
jgi:esterase/lipase superfamily enzyme